MADYAIVLALIALLAALMIWWARHQARRADRMREVQEAKIGRKVVAYLEHHGLADTPVGDAARSMARRDRA